jgi:hypothetical protein
MNKFYLVEFACFEDSSIENFLLDEETYDRWQLCEPPVGYRHFKLIWEGKISQIRSLQKLDPEVAEDLRKWADIDDSLAKEILKDVYVDPTSDEEIKKWKVYNE